MDEIPKWRKLAPYTTEQLEQNWIELKQKLGKVPTTKDLNDKNLGRFPTYTYEKKYGSYDNFLIHMNETPPQKAHPPYTKDELIAVYHKSKTDSNIRNSFVRGGLRRIVLRLFGNYANLAQEADGTTEYTTVCKRCSKKNVINDLRKQRFIFKEKIKYCKECQEQINSRKPPTEQLIENYEEVCRILGRRPVADDLSGPKKPGRYSLGPYKHKFGSWNKFLISVGVTPIIKPPILDEQSLRKNWIDIKTRLGRIPTTRDLNDRSLSVYTTRNYVYHYKNYKKAANAMGDEPNYITKENK